MICTWCGKGVGRRYCKDKNGKIHYYVCFDCVGLFIESQNAHAKALLEGKTKMCGVCKHIHLDCEISKSLSEEKKNWGVVKTIQEYFGIESLAEVCTRYEEIS